MPGKILSDKLLERLIDREQMTDTQVAEYLKEHENIVVTRQAISAWRYRNEKKSSASRELSSSSAIPWKLRPEHTMSEPARAIRWFQRRQAGLPLSEDDQRRLDRVIHHLETVDGVFFYEPDAIEGWFIVPRREGVDTGIIREPDAA